MAANERGKFTELPSGQLGSGRPLIAIGIVAVLVLIVALTLEFSGVSLPLAIPGYALFYGLLGIVAGWYILAVREARRESDKEEGPD